MLRPLNLDRNMTPSQAVTESHLWLNQRGSFSVYRRGETCGHAHRTIATAQLCEFATSRSRIRDNGTGKLISSFDMHLPYLAIYLNTSKTERARTETKRRTN